MHIDAIKDTFILGKIGRSKWEAGRNGARVHVAANLKLVGTLWHD